MPSGLLALLQKLQGVALASPGSLTEMQNFSCHLLTQNLNFNKVSQCFVCLLKLEKHGSRGYFQILDYVLLGFLRWSFLWEDEVPTEQKCIRSIPLVLFLQRTLTNTAPISSHELLAKEKMKQRRLMCHGAMTVIAGKCSKTFPLKIHVLICRIYQFLPPWSISDII